MFTSSVHVTLNYTQTLTFEEFHLHLDESKYTQCCFSHCCCGIEPVLYPWQAELHSVFFFPQLHKLCARQTRTLRVSTRAEPVEWKFMFTKRRETVGHPSNHCNDSKLFPDGWGRQAPWNQKATPGKRAVFHSTH